MKTSKSRAKRDHDTTNVSTPPSAPVIQLVAERVALELLVRNEIERQWPQTRRNSVAAFTKHPAVLLLLTFLFTTAAGSIITSWWQYQQWAREEALRANQELTTERLAVISTTAQSVATSFAAAEDVLHLFAFDWHKDSRVVTLKERGDHWTTRSREWRVSEKILSAKVAAAFPDAVTRALLQSIIDDRTYVGNDIEHLLSMADVRRGRYSPHEAKDIEDTTRHALERINGVSRQDQKLAQLVRHMIEQTRRDQRTPPPRSLWNWLFSIEVSP